MEYIYGALLLHSAGKAINEGDLTKVLEAAGVSVEAARVKAVVTSLEGVNIEEAMATAVAADALINSRREGLIVQLLCAGSCIRAGEFPLLADFILGVDEDRPDAQNSSNSIEIVPDEGVRIVQPVCLDDQADLFRVG